ncbi:MAG: nucleotidyltransferase domain-containing protein [Desulfobacteraceae bacterium]|nr:nucleotidyltransferase domain-containing protein [Desulfobacteraceae bacterium]
MATITDIEQISASIAREFKPQKIVLFGSHAWGTPTPDSDVDMLVILPFEGKGWRMATAIREKIKVTFPLDLIVRTESQIEDRLNKHDSFISEIVEKGRVLHEA